VYFYTLYKCNVARGQTWQIYFTKWTYQTSACTAVIVVCHTTTSILHCAIQHVQYELKTVGNDSRNGNTGLRTTWVVGCSQCVDVSSTDTHVSVRAAIVQSVASYDGRCRVWPGVVMTRCCRQRRRRGQRLRRRRRRSSTCDGGRLLSLDVTAKRHGTRFSGTH